MVLLSDISVWAALLPFIFTYHIVKGICWLAKRRTTQNTVILLLAFRPMYSKIFNLLSWGDSIKMWLNFIFACITWFESLRVLSEMIKIYYKQRFKQNIDLEMTGFMLYLPERAPPSWWGLIKSWLGLLLSKETRDLFKCLLNSVGLCASVYPLFYPKEEIFLTKWFGADAYSFGPILEIVEESYYIAYNKEKEANSKNRVHCLIQELQYASISIIPAFATTPGGSSIHSVRTTTGVEYSINFQIRHTVNPEDWSVENSDVILIPFSPSAATFDVRGLAFEIRELRRQFHSTPILLVGEHGGSELTPEDVKMLLEANVNMVMVGLLKRDSGYANYLKDSIAYFCHCDQ